jgi:hypothetical protein
MRFSSVPDDVACAALSTAPEREVIPREHAGASEPVSGVEEEPRWASVRIDFRPGDQSILNHVLNQKAPSSLRPRIGARCFAGRYISVQRQSFDAWEQIIVMTERTTA